MKNTSIKISKKKAGELLNQSNLIYFTSDNNLLTNIVYYFDLNQITYYISLDNNNNAIIVDNEKITQDTYQWIRKQSQKETKYIINIDYASYMSKTNEIIDYWYCSKSITLGVIEPLLLRFINDNKDKLTSDELTLIKKWLINKIKVKEFRLSEVIDYINSFGLKIVKRGINLISGETIALYTWLDKEEIKH